MFPLALARHVGNAVRDLLPGHKDRRDWEELVSADRRLFNLAQRICDQSVTAAQWAELWAEAEHAHGALEALESTYDKMGWEGLLPFCGHLGKLHQVRLWASVALHHELLFRSLQLELCLRRDLAIHADDPRTRSPAVDQFKAEDAWRAYNLTTTNGFFDAATALPALSYVATDAFNDVGSDTRRIAFSVAAFATAMSARESEGHYLPQHQRVTMALDTSQFARAWVVTSFQPTPKAAKKGSRSMDDSARFVGCSVMLNPEALPPTHDWKPVRTTIFFTGTESTGTWLYTNLKVFLCAMSHTKGDGIGEGAAHSGFMAMLDSVWPDIKGALRNPFNTTDPFGHLGDRSYKLALLGHSLGGALATLCAPRVLALVPRHAGGHRHEDPAAHEPETWVITIASPRAMDEAAVRAHSGHNIRVKRLVMEGDVVPSLPADDWMPVDAWKYHHVHIGFDTFLNAPRVGNRWTRGQVIGYKHSAKTYRAAFVQRALPSWVGKDHLTECQSRVGSVPPHGGERPAPIPALEDVEDTSSIDFMLALVVRMRGLFHALDPVEVQARAASAKKIRDKQ